jgi:2'-5' RNA ligase
MQYFYALFVAEPHIRHAISTLRFLCDPSQKYAAHVTVRGPYSKSHRADLERWSRRIAGASIDVWGVGSFRSNTQATVFLHCDSPILRRVWYKPRLGYVPHITLYDGRSQIFADRLEALLNDYNTHFSFSATKLFELRSSQGQRSFELTTTVKEAEITGFSHGYLTDLESIRSLNDASRLILVQQLCDILFTRAGIEPTVTEQQSGVILTVNRSINQFRLTPR